jgi:hypothetical protein
MTLTPLRLHVSIGAYGFRLPRPDSIGTRKDILLKPFS